MKAVLGYIASVIMAILYMVYLDEEVGMIILSAVLFVPLISLLITRLAKRSIRINAEVSSDLINKGEATILKISVKKINMIPAPFVDLKLKVSLNFEPLNYHTCRISLSASKTEDLALELKGRICGSSFVGIESAYITDYLGIFKFRLKNTDNLIRKVSIIPNIPDEENISRIFDEICANISYDDEAESTQTSYTPTASAGYEHREYAGGDPIKRINWKLSSKRNKLMVRLDESPAIVKPIIILDTSAKNTGDELERLLVSERLTEGVLSLLMYCSKQSMECSFFFTLNGISVNHTIESEANVKQLALELAGLPSQKSASEPIAEDIFDNIKSGSTAVLFTAIEGERLHSASEEIERRGAFLHMITSAKSNSVITSAGSWYYDNSGQLRRSDE